MKMCLAKITERLQVVDLLGFRSRDAKAGRTGMYSQRPNKLITCKL